MFKERYIEHWLVPPAQATRNSFANKITSCCTKAKNILMAIAIYLV